MATIGIIAESSEESTMLEQHLKDNYTLVQIVEKEELTQTEQVVIMMGSTDSFLTACEWLLSAKEHPKLCTWVYGPNASDSEREFLYQLGSLGVLSSVKEVSYVLSAIEKKMNHLVERKEKKGTPLLQLDSDMMSLTYNGQKIVLTRLEYKLMYLLVNERNRLVPYEEILRQLWKDDDIEQKYRVSNVIFHLREKFKTLETELIRTVRSKGYLLLLPEETDVHPELSENCED